MRLIYGGSFQGKLDYVKKRYQKTDMDVFNCKKSISISFKKEIINSLHLYILACVENEIDVYRYLENNLKYLRDKTIICDDISCGIAPLRYKEKLWIETQGMILNMLSNESEEVYRIFCGLPTRLK